MTTSKSQRKYWTVCSHCQSRGKVDSKNNPNKYVNICKYCNGSGLQNSDTPIKPNHDKFPTIAIIGGGIGGSALAVALQHRGIPFVLYERDKYFAERSQGYGLTLQQASNAISGLGINKLADGVISDRHLVHTTNGNVIGQWGMRKHLGTNVPPNSKRKNIHTSRQSLREHIQDQIYESNTIEWNHKFIGFKKNQHNFELSFDIDGRIHKTSADIIVGADGIYSTVRERVSENKNMQLQYLDCIVVLGICSLNKLTHCHSDLLDGTTVFQTVNGHERMYVMPYDQNHIMWQFSYPVSEQLAKEISSQGAAALQSDACKRVKTWHTPVPDIVTQTDTANITGYPVYDRNMPFLSGFNRKNDITLIGDAAHPMSPFKGQGANQAILDALSLAKQLYIDYNKDSEKRTCESAKSTLQIFESEMQSRVESKVTGSRTAARLLHSTDVLRPRDNPRGRNI